MNVYREKNFGEVEGTTLDERIAKWGNNWKELPLGIEKDVVIAARGASFIQSLHRIHANKNILVVSHGALLARTLNRLIPDLDTSEQIQNTSITVLNYETDQWICELYNCTKHVIQER